MTGLRNLFKEHYIDVPEEKVDIVDDLFEKVEDLEKKLNEEIEKNVTLKSSLAESSKEGILSSFNELTFLGYSSTGKSIVNFSFLTRYCFNFSGIYRIRTLLRILMILELNH